MADTILFAFIHSFSFGSSSLHHSVPLEAVRLLQAKMTAPSIDARLNCRLLLVNYSHASSLAGLPEIVQDLMEKELDGSVDEGTIFAPYPKGRRPGSDLEKADCAMQIRARTFMSFRSRMLITPR